MNVIASDMANTTVFRLDVRVLLMLFERLSNVPVGFAITNVIQLR